MSAFSKNNLVKIYPVVRRPSENQNQEMSQYRNPEDYEVINDNIKVLKRKYKSTTSIEIKKSETYLEKFHEEIINNKKTENCHNAIKKIKVYQEKSLEKIKHMVKERDELNKNIDEYNEKLLESHQKAMEILKNNFKN